MTPIQIRTLRKKLDLSANLFAERLGFTGQNRALTVYRWENGEREPSNQTVLLMRQLTRKRSK